MISIRFSEVHLEKFIYMEEGSYFFDNQNGISFDLWDYNLSVRYDDIVVWM